MKLCRFNDDRLGLVTGDQIVDVSEAIECLPAVKWPYGFADPLIANWTTLRPAIEKAALNGRSIPIGSAILRSPIAHPSKVVGIARNRRNLGAEQLNFSPSMNRRDDGDPLDMFIKASSSVAGAGDGVRLRFPERRTDPEVELTVVIGQTAVDVPKERAMDHIFGYCVGLDMSAREGKENMSTRKSFDTYALLGPWMVTKDEIPEPGNLQSVLLVNGKQVQTGNTRDLAFDVPTVVSTASRYFTLHPGDVIMMGTPVGFERVVGGDVMDIEFERIGCMTVKVSEHLSSQDVPQA